MLCVTCREAELVNKYHYAFSYFKKPLELKQYQSHILKKSFEMKKEVKPENVVKPRKTKVCATAYFYS